MLAQAALAATMVACPSAGDPLSPGQVSAISAYVQAEMARQQIPGLTLGVYRHGRAVLLEGYGVANLEHGVPATPDTVMQSGSIGKTFTAVLVMRLVEQGRLSLDDSIRAHLPDLPASWQPITITHLLSHTSGLAEHDTEELSAPGAPFDLRQDFAEEELVYRIAALPLEAAPGTTWAYRNGNFVVLGALIRRLTGVFHGDQLQAEIFGPLGMSSSRVISDRDIVLNRAAGYQIRGGKLYNQDWVSPTFNATADGTLYLTVRDMERWDRALCEGALLTPESQQRMWTPVPVDGDAPSHLYGLGWFLRDAAGQRIIEHSGAWQGFTSYYGRYPVSGLSVAVFTNLASSHSEPDRIAAVVAGLVDPALAPPPSVPIEDDRPQLSQASWAAFQSVIGGVEAPDAVMPPAEELNDLRANLPTEWDAHPPVLVVRRQEGAELVSIYRIGPTGDARRLLVVHDAAGQLTEFMVLQDPDNR